VAAGQIGVAWRKELVVDRLVDQLELAPVDLQVLLDLRAQALGVDDDGIGGLSGARIVHPAVQAGQRRDRAGRREGVHRLHMKDERPREVHEGRHQGVEDIDATERQPQGGVKVLAERARCAPLVRPRIGDVGNVRSVSLIEMPRFRAYQQVQLLTGVQSLGHLRDYPGPEPVRAGGVAGVFGQEVDCHAHAHLPHAQAPDSRHDSEHIC
jgi:hypothetical protein